MVPKFRGRNIETGEWVYGHLFYFDDGRHFISPTGTDVVGGYGGAPAKYRLENLVCFEITPKTLGQSTGLKDKNGVVIFEGDIVVNQYGNVGYVAYLQQEAGFVVVLKKSDYRLGHRNTGESYDVTTNHEVIGNIHSNPELLDKSNEN